VGRIKVGDEIELHQKALKALIPILEKPYSDGPTVVVTHHAPHPDCLPASLGRAWMAGILASDLSRLIEETNPNLWIHGHTHNQRDFITPNGTRILCNPAGYNFNNPDFDECLKVPV
jgi:Icc-related predicted phosphoesterase